MIFKIFLLTTSSPRPYVSPEEKVFRGDIWQWGRGWEINKFETLRLMRLFPAKEIKIRLSSFVLKLLANSCTTCRPCKYPVQETF